MKQLSRPRFPVRKLSLTFAALGLLTLTAHPNLLRAQDTSNAEEAQANQNASDARKTAEEYVTAFYPLWFTYEQSRVSTPNQLVGPENVTPLYQAVVAINVDTLYASAFMQLSPSDPAILTIPSTTTIYSVLVLSPYGDIYNFNTSFPAGVYAFVGPSGYDNSQGPLPAGATVIQVPITNPTIIFRADKYGPGGQDLTSVADTFRRNLQLQFFSDYLLPTPPDAKTTIKSELNFAFPFKTVADTEINDTPLLFLTQLQEAVASPRTPPLSNSEVALSEHFNELFAQNVFRPELEAGAQAAHREIIRNYRAHRDPTGWISFQDIGHWNGNDLNRDSITEFLQYGNDFTSAAYFHVFVDGKGKPLNAANGRTYTLHFPPNQPPEAKRFWSITAYTPNAIELVPNSLGKYNVASYTPNLTYNPEDDSLTLYFGTEKPDGVPDANYLPVPPGDFNLMLRFYGPQGIVEEGRYVPPPVTLESAY